MARHDGRRAAAADGTGNIKSPVMGWKSYLGGRLRPTSLFAADVEGNGKNAFIIAVGGGVSAVRPDGTVIWSTPTAGTPTLVGLTDLNGDGKKEVVAYTGLRMLAIDLASGAIAWAQPSGQMGVLNGVRLADMNGDGLPDLVGLEGRGGNGYKNQTGFIYSFANGFSNAGTGTALPYPDANGSQLAVAVNMDGAPGDEILLLGFDGATGKNLLTLVGANGATVANTQPLAQTPSDCLPAGNLDGSPGDEVICVISSASAPGPSVQTEVYALTNKSQKLQKLWSVTLSAQNQVIAPPADDLAVDLVGDGHTETLIAGYDGTSYTVHILDALNLGQELAQIPGQNLLGTAPALKGGARVIITTSSSGLALWSYSQGAVQPLGTIGDDGVETAVDWARVALTSTGNPRPFSIDVNGDGLPDIVTSDSTTGTLHVYTPGPVPPTLVGTIPPQPSAPFNGIWPLPPMDRPYPQLALTATDGHLRLVDQTLAFTSTNFQVGGYYSSGGYFGLGQSPVVASLGSPAQQILVMDSGNNLLRLDASAVTAGGSPVKVWEQPSSTSPVIASGLNGTATGIFTLHVVDPTASTPSYTVRRLNPDGSVAWEVPIQGVPRQDMVLAQFEPGGPFDVALQTGIGMGVSHTLVNYAISGADGHILWSQTTMGCPSPDGVSIADWNGDGVDDVLYQGGATFVLSGVDGTQIATGGPTDCYNLLIPIDPDNSGTDSVVYTASNVPAQEYAHDLSTVVFQTMDQDQAFPYAAIADCPSGPVLVEGSYSSPSRLKLTTLGSSPGTVSSVFLVNGMLYNDEMSADAAGSGQLSPANVHKNLTGSGTPSAVVGSSDGWLYAVDPCQATLTFTYNFNAPVGEPIFGDTDGDGFDEIIVEVGDGYLYDLRGTPLQGTGGSATGGSGTGGFGAGGSGAGGAPTSSSATGGTGPFQPIYGRATCVCSTGPTPDFPTPTLAFTAALAAAFARRSRRPARRSAGSPRS